MNNPLVKSLLVLLAVLFVVAPFAGLAPLLLLLLGMAVFYAIASIFIPSPPSSDQNSTQSQGD